MFDKISNFMTDMIYSTLPNVDPKRREIIEYGVYMVVSEIVKISIILAVSLILDILPYVITAVAVYGIQRTFLGGIHAKTHIGCILSHAAIIFGVVSVSIFLSVERLYLVSLIAPLSYITAYLYAPADLPQKPVKSKKQRKWLRIGGFALLTLLFSASLFLPLIWSNIILFSCFIQALLMTPLAYKITNNKYGREEVSA